MELEQPESSMQMVSHKKAIRNLAIFLFSVGVLLGMFLAGAATWTDLEATFYGFEKVANDPLTTLRCPVLMTATETGIIRATLSNNSELPVDARVRVYVSNPGPIRIVETITPLAPGETKKLEWTVTSEDVDFGNLILVKVLAFAYYKVPVREEWCGILVLNLPYLTGNQIFVSALVLGLLGMLIGIGLWVIGGRPLKGKTLSAIRAMIWLVALVLADMVVSFMGLWLIGLIFFVTAALLILGVLTSAVLAS
jgi:hypothetical protein